MPNKDLHHDIVVRALVKAGWEILKEQQYLSIGTSGDTLRRLYIDIKAQYASRQIVLVEVKGLENSPVHELMELVGQYLVYQAALDYLEDDTPLYIAIPDHAYELIIKHPLGQQVFQKNPVPLVIYNPSEERLIQWIPSL